jgi:hypothetical protein
MEMVALYQPKNNHYLASNDYLYYTDYKYKWVDITTNTKDNLFTKALRVNQLD